MHRWHVAILIETVSGEGSSNKIILSKVKDIAAYPS